MNSLETSIFLNGGAFVRWNDHWTLFLGPFSPLNSDKNQVNSIVCTNFFDEKPLVLAPKKVISIDPNEWSQHFKLERSSDFRDWKGPRRELYSRSFQTIFEAFRQGKWQKAVPIAFDRSSGGLKPEEFLAMLSCLGQAPTNLIPYGFWQKGSGFIGATPEILYHRKGRRVSSMALAGTQKKSGTPSTLMNDPKIQMEHQFVVDELKQKWSSLGNVKVAPREVLELPSLFHLLTKMDIELNDEVLDVELIQKLHPTSALGVYPPHLWRELIELPEQKERGCFGAPLLFSLPEEETLALVGLRQIQWSETELRIGAGGGVVASSQEELEWMEILAKIESVKRLFNLERR